MHRYTILNRGDLDEHGNSKEGKLFMLGQKKCIKAILTKLAFLKSETNHAWLQNFTWGDLNENNNFEVWKLIRHG